MEQTDYAAGEETAVLPAEMPRLLPMDPAQLLLILNRARHQTVAVLLRSGVWFDDARCVGLTITYTWQGKVISFRVRVPTPNGDRELWLAGSAVADVMLSEDAVEADLPGD